MPQTVADNEVLIYRVHCFPRCEHDDAETVTIKVKAIRAIKKANSYKTIKKNRVIKFSNMMVVDSVTTDAAPSSQTYCLEADIESACEIVKSTLEQRVKLLARRYASCLDNISKNAIVVMEDPGE
jgi:hypothetical protein